MPTLFASRATTLALAPIFAIAIACSTTNPSNDAGPKPQVCPSTIVQATATSGDAGEGTNDMCHVDGYICVVGFQCGNFTQQASCVCTLNSDGSKKFVCSLAANGKIVADNTTDTEIPTTLCTSIDQDAQADTCPTDKTTAGGTTCKNAGQQCFYKGLTCPGDTVPRTDVCQCGANSAGDAGLSWACDLSHCN